MWWLIRILEEKIKSAKRDLHNFQENNGDKEKIKIITGEIMAYEYMLNELKYHINKGE